MLFNKKNKKINLPANNISKPETDWFDYKETEIEGQLAIDVYQTTKKIFIKSTIAGVKPENLKIALQHDLLTINGTRSSGADLKEENYLYRECYWGAFSRSIILPAEVDPKRVEADLENGVLTITLYKNNPGQIEVKVKD
ncbi:MAG: Hsp20/alpha crystallin family protein [Patescibacteria group bacterium]|jgi:HSP20 family protein